MDQYIDESQDRYPYKMEKMVELEPEAKVRQV